MNRRSLLKALAGVSVMSAMSACKRKDDDDRSQPSSEQKSAPHQLQILLDGAFAVVLQQDKANSILAFSPRDKEEPHQFYFNDPGYAQASGQNYNFELSLEDVKKELRTEHPDIAPGLSDFRANVKHWKLTENFVTIKLPTPKKITFAGHRERVIFSSKKTGWMPTNHILEYDIADPGQIKMVCKELAKGCAPSPDSPSGLTRFFFEVGPPRGTSHSHAINFFNYMLSTSFPELVAEYSLGDILDKRDEGSSTTARLVSSAFTEDSAPARLRNASYTLDCKIGGLLVNAPSGPE